jgi:hypothetical protein
MRTRQARKFEKQKIRTSGIPEKVETTGVEPACM